MGEGRSISARTDSSLQEVCLASCDLCLLEWPVNHCPFPRTSTIKSEMDSLHLICSSNLSFYV